MTASFGEISWSDDIFGTDKKESSKDLFLRLSEGSNEVRLLTNPYQYLHHRYKREGDPGFGVKVQCSSPTGSCPLCSAGDKPKTRWLFGVIDRKTQSYKVLDVSYAVFSDVRKLARNTARWGDPTKYDIDIIVDKKGGATGYYSVQPISKEPLSAADQAIKDNIDFEDLKRRVTPPTAAQVQGRLDKMNGATTATSTDSPQATSPKQSGKGVMPVPSADDDDDVFPNV